MKKRLTLLLLSLGCATFVSAQMPSRMNSTRQTRPAEVIKLSSRTDGDYLVERFLLKEQTNDNDQFEAHYKVDLKRLLSQYDENSEEIEGLEKFIKSIQNDSLKQITKCTVVGYASPDGPVAYNERLSKARATDCASYLASNSPLKNCNYETEWIASDWNDAKSAISRSNIPNKSRVIAIIDSGDSQSAISTQLKAIPSSWQYICREILPPMRCAKVQLKYNSWRVVEERELLPEVKAKSKKVIIDNRSRRPGGYYNVATGILISMPDEPLDYKNCRSLCNKRDKVKDKYKSNQRRAKYKERNGRFREEERLRTYYR